MKVLSLNCGGPEKYEFGGMSIMSSMRRKPIETVQGIDSSRGLRVLFDRVDGDKFDVPKAHGIKEAVVYAFSSDAFAELSRLLGQDVGAGHVGENLTIDSLNESDFMIGDEFEVGSVRLRATGPRYPCNRLNFTFQRANAMKLFLEHGRSGVYFEVLQEGWVKKGDVLRLVKKNGCDISVLDLYNHMREVRSAARSSEDSLSAEARLAHRHLIAENARILASPHISQVMRSRCRMA